jgi:hypothetical protein
VPHHNNAWRNSYRLRIGKPFQMNDLLPQLICAHLVGDFVLQNNDMAKNKASCSTWCAAHVAIYSIPFVIVCMTNKVPPVMPWLLLAILIQHYFQDRYALHLKWMKLYGQTPPDKWPTGPLCVDQAFHIGFIWICTLFL